MNEANEQEKLIKEEQAILNNLINRMDGALMKLDKRLNKLKLEEKKAKDKCLPDTYGLLIQKNNEIKETRSKIKEIYESKDELYRTRIVADVTDYDGEKVEEEIKIGLHFYSYDKEYFIYSWLMDVCRHYLFNSTDEEYIVKVKQNGREYQSKYVLKMKRDVGMRFTKVKKVAHLFPIMSEEHERAIFDEFLAELLERRLTGEFQNIVFSIQKKQGEIIQRPFEEDIIVQGCAGSGKSMIMLHRLPILLYDYPDSLDRMNLYIITPSQAYIQMAKSMLNQLEISDLNMGTLKQYYDHVIEKYNRNAEEYGPYNPLLKIAADMEEYIYSDICIDDICAEIELRIDQGRFDFNRAKKLFKIKSLPSQFKNPKEEIITRISMAQDIINQNNNVLKQYHVNIKFCIDAFQRLKNSVLDQKAALIRDLRKAITAEEERIKEKNKELESLNIQEDSIKYNNRKKIIENSIAKIQEYNKYVSLVEEDEEYFERINVLKNKVEELLLVFHEFNESFDGRNVKENYENIAKIGLIIGSYYSLAYEYSRVPRKYESFVATALLEKRMEDCELIVRLLQEEKREYLSEHYITALIESNEYMKRIEKELPITVYKEMMKGVGIEPNEDGMLESTYFSPYLYLQIMYLIHGAPNATKESLVTIDEAQGVSPAEISLIRNVNDNKVVLNLFGDENQHIEGTKGIDSWSDLSSVFDFKKYDLLENYRNAKQITEYCNRRFGMNMNAINLDGKGVSEIHDYEELKMQLNLLLNRESGEGLKAIIVKNAIEMDFVLREFAFLSDKINPIMDDSFNIHEIKWNLMTIDEAKGLEFFSVIAISGKMTKNEKYIAYTRALDELYVYDQILNCWDCTIQKQNVKKEDTGREEHTVVEPDKIEESAGANKNSEKKVKKEKQTTGKANKKINEATYIACKMLGNKNKCTYEPATRYKKPCKHCEHYIPYR